MMFKLNRYCACCGKDLEPEPSFYTGALYVNYGFQVALVITVFTAFNVLFEDPDVWAMISVAIGSAIVLSPLIFRISQSIWATMFFKYNKEAINNFKSGKYEA